MIREERDATFWSRVIGHPALEHVLQGHDPSCIATLLNEPNVPLASDNGGFIFVRADTFGRTYELHTLYTPEGWGREVFQAARQAFDRMFSVCDLIVTHETPHPQSRPPRTFRFVPLGDFADTDFGPVRLWQLTRQAWEASPARNR